jgi:hypothetical protein
MNQLQFRTNVLIACGAKDSEIQELLAYNQNVFSPNNTNFTLYPEPHIATWEKYVTQAETIGIYEVLKQRLLQFQFPIVAGISETEEYRQATRQGKPIKTKTSRLIFTEPTKLKLQLHQTLAGSIPVIIAANREDFVTLVQALTKRNEPHPIPDSMGACIVSGYNNWDRIHQYRLQWTAQQVNNSEADWDSEFKRLIPKKELYQDRFIILSPGSYSNVTASDLGLAESQWQELSLKIRLEHECTHYLTHRFFGSMRNHIFDELIADYRGIVAAIGHYKADWFLHFLGLESSVYREGGRLQNYRGEPPLSDGAFRILQILVKKAAKNIESFDREFSAQLKTSTEQIAMVFALTRLTLEELASEFAKPLLESSYRRQSSLIASFYSGDKCLC